MYTQVDPHSHLLLSLGVDGELRVWDVSTYALIQLVRPQVRGSLLSRILFLQASSLLFLPSLFLPLGM